MKKIDLNNLRIHTDSGNEPLQNFNAVSGDGNVSVYFREIENVLISHIKSADLVVGCVAWLTSQSILTTLSNVKDGVAIVVQKEDFLRPDLGAGDQWKAKLRSMYGNLKNPHSRYSWRGLLGSLSTSCDPTVSPVRCVGNHNRGKKPAFPRMHHKFLVFCKSVEVVENDITWFEPKPLKVWTGSFNLTKNAGNSFENAVVLSDPKIVNAYFGEWQQIEALSEPLDWKSEWVEPEWRVGT